MISVVKSIMIIIVTGSRRDGSYHVEVFEGCDLLQVALSKEHVHRLCDIAPMQIVMVLNTLAIARADSSQEANQFIGIDCESIVHFGYAGNHLIDCHREDIAPLERLLEFYRIEVPCVHTLHFILESHQLSIHVVGGGVLAEDGELRGR